MKAYSGLSGKHPLLRFRVEFEGGRAMCVSTNSAEQARAIAEQVSGRVAVLVELLEDEPAEEGDPRKPR